MNGCVHAISSVRFELSRLFYVPRGDFQSHLILRARPGGLLGKAETISVFPCYVPRKGAEERVTKREKQKNWHFQTPHC